MTIDEAIKHEEEVSVQQIQKANALDNIPLFGMSKDDIEEIKECYKCSKEHEQLAEWLKELKAHREAWEEVSKELKEWQNDPKIEAVAQDAYRIVLYMIMQCKPKECGEK